MNHTSLHPVTPRRPVVLCSSDAALRAAVMLWLEAGGVEPLCIPNSPEALLHAGNRADLLVLDARDGSLSRTLPLLRQHNPDVGVVVLLPSLGADRVLEALRLGAMDVLGPVLDREALNNAVRRVGERLDRERQLRARRAPAPAASSAQAPEKDRPSGLFLASVNIQELERKAIIQALQSTGGSVTKAARLLGMGRATLYRRLAEEDLRGTQHAARALSRQSEPENLTQRRAS